MRLLSVAELGRDSAAVGLVTDRRYGELAAPDRCPKILDCCAGSKPRFDAELGSGRPRDRCSCLARSQQRAREYERRRCRLGGELLGASLAEVEPGNKLWPYHTHHLNEEWVIVLRGEPTLRTPEGEHVLEEGDIVCFPRGKIGAHQLSNRTDAPVRVLMLSSMIRGEIIEYLDTGKVLAKDVDDEDVMFARPGPAVEYWEGED